MRSATQFIDFFIHDILDYSVLNEDSTNFTPKNTFFDIRQAIKHITDMQEDKVDFKQIMIRKQFIGFEKNTQNNETCFMVKTDLKRF